MTWVLLRGLMREKRHWGDFLAAFEAAFPDENVITIDFPGNGELVKETSASTIEAMLEAARTQVRQRQPHGNLNLLAISLGAMVAVAWAQAYPQEIQKMVLINTSLSPHNPFYHRLRPQNYLRLLTTMLFANVTQREHLVFALTSNHKSVAIATKAINAWVGYANQYPISRSNIFRQLLAAMRYQSPHQIPHLAPQRSVLLLAGAGDHLVNPRCSTTLASKWRCQLFIHQEAGHDLPLDDGAWVITQIQTWLEEAENQPPRSVPRQDLSNAH